ncbi:MAG: DUF4350 domain-containing protein [Kordia sp.]|uniref:DUF4350 domain-containing protein n=1 Tax=Kordia sp. TaxID=1965332 RepID=UPI00385DABEF
MSKRLKIYLGILIAILIAVVVVELSKPTPLDWRQTYNERQKKPYDLKVFHEELATILYSGKIKNVYRTPFEYFRDQYDFDRYEYKIRGSFISITPDFLVDPGSIHELLDYAAEGNIIFISSNDMPRYLRDSLGFSIKNDLRFKSETTLSFVNRRLQNNKVTFKERIQNVHFSSIDTLSTTVLGYQQFKNDSTQTKYTNFIHVPIGQGSFLLHTQPTVFTNFQLLKDNQYKYTEGILAFIPNEDVFFDSPNKIAEGEIENSDSELRFILAQPALRWAWYLALTFLAIFILFNIKRKQRFVKVIKPLENTTVDFTKTIGNLYYETKDHKNVAHKKVTYFLEYLRTEYFMDTQVLDEAFCKRLHQKSGKPLEETERLIKLVKILKKKLFFDENDVIRITDAIEKFRRKDN